MSPNQSLAVVVRLFALWLIAYFITAGPWVYVQAERLSPDSAWAYSLGAGAVVLALSVVLWHSASWLAQRLIAGPSEVVKRSSAFDSWFSVGCALIGLWVLAKAIPALLHYLVANFLGAGVFPNTYVVAPEWHLTAIFNTIQLSFGLALFLGGKGLGKVVLWVRNAY